MKKLLASCLLLALWLSLGASNAGAIDVGWMQKGVRVWYFGGAGLASGSSDAEEAYLITAVNGDNVQVTKHSAVNHWGSPNPIDNQTYSFFGNPQQPNGPFWIHPQTLQTLNQGNYWKGLEIVTVYRDNYTYDTLPAELLHLLPAKALFDHQPQRQLVKLVYMLPYSITGMAYFDAETGLCLLYTQSTGLVTVFFILSEINYDFATHQAFAEDNGPHTGFKSYFMEEQITASFDILQVIIQSSVETRYGGTVEMWITSSDCGPANYGSCNNPPFENYCFFGGIPVLRHINMDATPMPPPDQWNAYGQYLWWWVPTGVLQNSTINVFGVPMTRTSNNPSDPYTSTLTPAQEPAGLFFSKLWFDNDGYVTAFSAKDNSLGLDMDPGYPSIYWQNSTTVNGLAYYKNTMGRATPAEGVYATFTGHGVWKWDGTTWTQLNAQDPANMAASGSSLYSTFTGHGVWKWDGTTWTQLNAQDPANMAASGSSLYSTFTGHGVWKWDGTTWTQLNAQDPANMAASGSSLYSTFTGHGVWKWDGTTWTQLNAQDPANMAASGSSLYSTFTGHGVWKWDGTTWTQLNAQDPANMAASGSSLYSTFTGHGVWKWDGTTWTQLNAQDPANMAASGF